MTPIIGACHCGNIRFVFHWPGDPGEIPVRACGCEFCLKHGGTYTSHREGRLEAVIADRDCLSTYRFGTKTADFYICARCGAVPFVTSEIQGTLHAVVNVNTFEGIPRQAFVHATSDFEGESVDDRLNRRGKTWIPSVSIR